MSASKEKQLELIARVDRLNMILEHMLHDKQLDEPRLRMCECKRAYTRQKACSICLGEKLKWKP